MIELMTAILKLDPAIGGMGLGLFSLILYGTYRGQWKLHMMMTALSVDGINKKTGKVPVDTWQKYGVWEIKLW